MTTMAERKKDRKGPADSATAFSAGTEKKGNDGAMWVVIETKTGTRRWKRVVSTGTKFAGKKRLRIRLARKPDPRNTLHHIVFVEPWSFEMKQVSTSPKKGPLSYLDAPVPIPVNGKFYQTLLRAPKKYKGHGSNAYRFGKSFPVNDFKLIASHGNDAAQTGLIDLDRYREKSQGVAEYLMMSGLFKDKPWDDRASLKTLRKNARHILFLGDTVGGDVGANLYAHYGSDGNIDSLIIDNNYFFPDGDLPHSSAR